MRMLKFLRNGNGTAAVEMALVAPLLLVLMFGSLELGNMFMDQHALTKQVRDGARFASRLAINSAYSCPGSVFEDADATDQIIHVTKDGVVTGAGTPRWSSYWSRNCDGGGQTLTVSIRCVAKADVDSDDTGFTGIYTSLDGPIPVVTVAGAVKYRSVLASLGFDATDVCLQAQSDAAVQGL
jgi:Flp pilus assembly protein TadG